MAYSDGEAGELPSRTGVAAARDLLRSVSLRDATRPARTWAGAAADSVRPAANRLAEWLPARQQSISVPGAIGAMVAYLAANTPSLLPRPWPVQGLIAAICALFGYGVGLTIAWVLGRFARWADFTVSIRPGARLLLRRLWIVTLTLGVLGFPFLSVQWQTRTARFVGLPGPGLAYVVGSAIVAVVVFLALIGLWQVIERLFDWVLHLGNRVMREVLARILASVVVAVVVLGLVNQVVIRAVMQVATRVSQQVNQTSPLGLAPPQSALRSGSAASPESWQSLGLEGAEFVSGGPTGSAIAAATGRPAEDPVRVYAGLSGGRTLADARDAVIAEMDRTGAFGRERILLVTTTGRGWVNEWNASAFEYLGGGDTAIVAMQYSTLPSALALLSAQSEPPAAATLLFEAVERRLDAIAQPRRPKLYVGGESLGAFGSTAAFTSPADLLSRVDGAVWTGTPGFTPMHQAVTAMREGGSTQVNPVVDNGRHFRFAGTRPELTADQFGRDLGPWAYPRIAFLQHSTDPVVWWSSSLLSQTPGWLVETRSPGPMEQMSWLPFVTFWQVSADLAVANSVPDGYGHQYHSELVPAWAAVLGQDPGADHSAVTSAITASVSAADARSAALSGAGG